MPIEIRPFRATDANAVSEVYFLARRETFFWRDPRSFALTDFARDTRDEPILVATLHQVPVGFVSWWPPDNFIHNLFVQPGHHRQGIGRLLLTACLQQIGRPATLKCVRQNAAALAFYQKLGWEIAGEGSSQTGDYFLMKLA